MYTVTVGWNGRALNAIRIKHHEFGREFLKCKNMIKEGACYVSQAMRARWMFEIIHED